MEKSFINLKPALIDYIEKTFRPEDSALTRIRESIVQNGLPPIQVGMMDGLHLEVLTRMLGAKKIVEIGTLGGYSGTCLARALPADGVFHTFELSEKNATLARQNFDAAGLGCRIEIHRGEALKLLPTIEKEGPFDLVFIDADKGNYCNYLEWAKANLRKGGAILADNTLGFGLIADPVIEDQDRSRMIESLRKYNASVASDPELRSTLLPTGEGLTLSIKL